MNISVLCIIHLYKVFGIGVVFHSLSMSMVRIAKSQTSQMSSIDANNYDDRLCNGNMALIELQSKQHTIAVTNAYI